MSLHKTSRPQPSGSPDIRLQGSTPGEADVKGGGRIGVGVVEVTLVRGGRCAVAAVAGLQEGGSCACHEQFGGMQSLYSSSPSRAVGRERKVMYRGDCAEAKQSCTDTAGTEDMHRAQAWAAHLVADPVNHGRCAGILVRSHRRRRVRASACGASATIHSLKRLFRVRESAASALTTIGRVLLMRKQWQPSSAFGWPLDPAHLRRWTLAAPSRRVLLRPTSS